MPPGERERRELLPRVPCPGPRPQATQVCRQTRRPRRCRPAGSGPDGKLLGVTAGHSPVLLGLKPGLCRSALPGSPGRLWLQVPGRPGRTCSRAVGAQALSPAPGLRRLRGSLPSWPAGHSDPAPMLVSAGAQGRHRNKAHAAVRLCPGTPGTPLRAKVEAFGRVAGLWGAGLALPPRRSAPVSFRTPLVTPCHSLSPPPSSLLEPPSAWSAVPAVWPANATCSGTPSLATLPGAGTTTGHTRLRLPAGRSSCSVTPRSRPPRAPAPAGGACPLGLPAPGRPVPARTPPASPVPPPPPHLPV